MPERGKCQACGVYANLETVKLSVRGKIVFERDLHRACADVVEDEVKRAVNDLAVLAALRASAPPPSEHAAGINFGYRP